MKTKEELINHYEKLLEKATNVYKDNHRFEDYIEHAKKQLEAVKNGRQW